MEVVKFLRMVRKSQGPFFPGQFFSGTIISGTIFSGHRIADGTFKACPPGFSQIYSILGYGKYKNEAIPCIIALMKGRSADIYEAFFGVIKTKLLEKFNHSGKVFMFLCDFESPVIKTVTKLFPQIRVRGCIFHFPQALLRHMTGIRAH